MTYLSYTDFAYISSSLIRPDLSWCTSEMFLYILAEKRRIDKTKPGGDLLYGKVRVQEHVENIALQGLVNKRLACPPADLTADSREMFRRYA